MLYNLPRFHLRYSLVSICTTVVAALVVTYIGLIAVVMSYAAHTVEFSQSLRNDEAAVAALEAHYLNTIARITATDYTVAGYVTPVAKTFVPAKSGTALR